MSTKTSEREQRPPSRSPLRRAGSRPPKDYDFFKVVQDYLERAAKAINLRAVAATKILTQGRRTMSINPVRWTTARCGTFKGIPMAWPSNNLLGTWSRGREAPADPKRHASDDVKALAAMMTW